jgi:hypothetical protein
MPGIIKINVHRKIQRSCHKIPRVALAQLLKPSRKSPKLTGSGERDIFKYKFIDAISRIAATMS